MRGKNTINKIATSLNPEQGSIFPPGAELSLYELKVKAILARYYFYSTQHMKGELILSKLQKEFFLSTERIADIISEGVPDIQTLRKDAPPPSWFKIQWAHLVW